MIAAPVICICLVALLIKPVIIPAVKYRAAVSLANEENYDEAISAFEALGDYRDSAEQIENCKAEIVKNTYRSAEVGDIIYFGNYEQDDDTSDGKEPIAWRVLAKEDDRILVISNNVIDHKAYSTGDDSIPSYTLSNRLLSLVPWEICALRTWLNDTFLNEAFNSEEQAVIPYVTVTVNSYCDYYGTVYPANDTTDRVFLLSVDEVNQYFDNDAARSCGEWWWLRTPVENLNEYYYTVYTVSDRGYISVPSYSLRMSLGVRPAMWIDLSNL